MHFYEDFDLRVQSDGDCFTVRAQSGTQVATEPLEIDDSIAKDVRHLEGADPKVIDDRGAYLFDALVRGRVRNLYQQARGRAAGDSGPGLRIRLIFNPRDERLRRLIALPWEILRDRTDDINDLPALDSRRPVVRTLESVAQRLTPAGGPLQRVLVALADPSASDASASGPGDLHQECAAVVKALARISIHPTVVKNATRNSLFEAITDTNAQIIHFMGHSHLNWKTGESVLHLQNEKGDGKDHLPGSAFAVFFAGRSAPRVLLLTSCLSAGFGRGGQPFAGIAFALVAAGLPAVIAMQSQVRDDCSVRFTERLYRRLSDGDPIEAAVADARRALRVGYPQSVDWASPVLFMRDDPAPVVQPKREESDPRPNPPPGSGVLFKTRRIKTQNNHFGGRSGDR